jgi:hypothetical protein
LRGGEFALHPFTEPPAASIQGSWEMLVMEAARLRDENAPPHPSVAPGPAKQEAGRVPTPKPRPDTRSTPVPSQAKAAPARIEEVLICSGDGEVLYEWQCQNTEERINFLEAMSQKSRQLAQGLELGLFDRLELETAHTRLIAQVRNDRGILVRLRQSAGETAESQVKLAPNL